MGTCILVVSTDRARLASTLRALGATGCQVVGASSFDEAQLQMEILTPSYVIADERLGPFNGMHLILRGRAERPGMGGMIVTAAHDAWLEREAARLGVEYMVRPPKPSELPVPSIHREAQLARC